MKTISHGILILNTAGELLLCHATGRRYWDIPKGGSAEGEGDPQTAVRETLEESGLQLNRGDLRELGRFAYRPDKALLLYAVLLERLDTRLLTCSSQYRDQWGGKCRLKWMPSGGHHSLRRQDHWCLLPCVPPERVTSLSAQAFT